jgi:hypothetical protein
LTAEGPTGTAQRSGSLTNRHTRPVINPHGMMSFGINKEDPKVKFEGVKIDGEVIHDHRLKGSAISN